MSIEQLGQFRGERLRVRLNDLHRAVFGHQAFSTLAGFYFGALDVHLDDGERRTGDVVGRSEGTLSSSSLELRSAEENLRLPGLPIFPTWQEDSRI